MVVDFGFSKRSSNDALKENVVIQLWVASCKTTEGGQNYYELTTKNKPNYILSDDGGGYSLYRMHSRSCTIKLLEDEDYTLRGEQPEGIISRVFRNKRPEMSPNISYYSVHEYPDRDFALSCGILASFCFPIFKTNDYSCCSDGVMEIVSTCDQALERFKKKYESLLFAKKIKMYHLYGFRGMIIQEHALLKVDHLMKVVCQTFQLPFAQNWLITDPNLGALNVVCQHSYRDLDIFQPWWLFKMASLQMGLNIGEGLVGKTYQSHKSFFCRDIKEFSITDHPLAHYARNCGSIACFTICLRCLPPYFRTCVLEFFLPTQEADSYYPQTLLNSLLATIKKHLRCFEVVSGEQLGQVISVEVINSSMHNEPEFFNIGQLESSLLHHNGSANEEDAYQKLPSSQLLFQNGTELEDENVMDLVKSNSDINLYEETATGELSKRTRHNVAENIHLDKLEEESHIKSMKPQLTSQAKRSKEIIEDKSDREKQSEKDISFESLSEHFGRPLDDAAKSFGVSRSTFKRTCRALGIERWKNGKRRMDDNSCSKLRRRLNDEEPSRRKFSCSGRPPVTDTVVAHRSHDLTKITVKAIYNGATIMFKLPDSAGIAELEDYVIERLHMERKSFSIKYQDDEGDWVLIACDKDVRECIDISRSLQKLTLKMLLDQPINHYES